MRLFKFKKKREKKHTELTDRQREEKKWLTILRNVEIYDGTSKGQIKIED